MTLKNSIDIHILQIFIFICGIAALSVSYCLQYIFHFIPCDLCLYARQLWKLVSVFALLGATIPPVNSVPRLNAILYYITLFWLCFSTVIGVLHFGIEQHWWHDFIASCSVNKDIYSVQDNIIKSCSDADYIHFGNLNIKISITLISLIYSLIVFFVCVLWRLFNNFCKRI